MNHGEKEDVPKRDVHGRRVAWGDYIALLGLVNMLDILVSVVSSLGEEGLNIIYRPTVSHREEDTDFDSIALLAMKLKATFAALNNWTRRRPRNQM